MGCALFNASKTTSGGAIISNIKFNYWVKKRRARFVVGLYSIFSVALDEKY